MNHSSVSDYMAHGFCFLWDPPLVWMHVISDIITGLAYYSISIAIFYFVYKRRDLPFLKIFILFGVFIFSCGSTHLLAAYTVYVPAYWLEGIVKSITAFVSIISAILFIPLIPKAIAMPSLTKALEEIKVLNKTLQREFEEHKVTEKAKSESEERFRLAMLGATDGLWDWDLKTNKVYYSPRWKSMLGYAEDELEDHIDSWKLLMHPDDVGPSLSFIQNLLKGRAEKYELELRLRHKDGHYLNILSRATLVRDADGEALRLVGTHVDITKHKKAEAEREQYFKFFQGATDLMCIADPNGAFMKTNPAFSQALGYSETELTAKPFIEFVHPDDRQSTLDEMARQLQRGFSLNFENRYMCKDGSFRWLSWRASYNKEEGLTYATARDITEIRQTEEALEKSEAFIKKILETVDEGFIVVDPHYKILSANRAFCSFVKLPEEDVVGGACYKITHDNDRPCFETGEECSVKLTFETGTPHMASHIHVTKEGFKQFVEMRSYPITDAAGKVVSAIETITDVTDRRKLEEQLRHAQRLESLGTLAGGVAHDFNNMLTAIIGYGSLLRMKLDKDSDLRPFVDQILSVGEKSAGLTRQLLAFSRRQILSPKEIDLNELIRGMGKLLTRLIGEDIELKIKLSDTVLKIMVDPGQLEQVLMNLCTNARDAMPNGGSLYINTGAAVLDEEYIKSHEMEKSGPYALISVSDDGEGMDETTRQRIFEPFFTTKELGKGTGLGLSIVYGIIKQHSGNVTVYSEPGKGTTFKIFLPLITFKNETITAAPAFVATRGGSETILVAEDNDDVRTLTKHVLKQFGYDVIEAVDGEDAINKFSENKDRVRLVILDVLMPKKSGKEACDEIKKINPHVKVLYTSGYTADIIAKKGIVEEGVDFISKPVAPNELLTKIREVLDSQ